jgi:metal-responsive CopG/Arc/MetJ family transcriptional regulator
MKNNAIPVCVSLYPAQIRKLEEISIQTGMSRSALIQQAVNIVINMRLNKNEVDQNVDVRSS